MHLHVFPRIAGDGFTIGAQWRLREQAKLDAVAGHVRHGVPVWSPSSRRQRRAPRQLCPEGDVEFPAL